MAESSPASEAAVQVRVGDAQLMLPMSDRPAGCPSWSKPQCMNMFVEPPAIYLYKQAVDFRESINGLSAIVEAEMDRSPFISAVFVFCNLQRDKVRALYWVKPVFAFGSHALWVYPPGKE